MSGNAGDAMQYAPGVGGTMSRCWANFDADKTFAYTTFRKVKLQDRTLGFMDLFLKLAVVIYIIIWVMYFKGGYLKISAPAGTTRLSLLEPNYTGLYQSGGLDHLKNICTTSPFNAPFQSHVSGPCTFVPASMFVQPPTVGPFALVTTRVSRSLLQTVGGCNTTDPTCKYAPVAGTSNYYYTAGVELATLFIDHNIRSADGTLIKDLSSMRGVMVDCDEKKKKSLKDFPRRAEGQTSAEYIAQRAFTLNELFQAATGTDKKKCQWSNLDLDSKSEVSPHTPGDANNTIRYDGAVFIVSITYDNTEKFAIEDVEYIVRVRRLPGTEYKILNVNPEALVTATPGSFTLLNSHGVMIVVVQTGKVGDFDFITMLVQLTAALTLLAVSAKVTDLLALFVLPHKAEYRKYMIKVSEDFSDFRERSKGPKLLDDTESGTVMQDYS